MKRILMCILSFSLCATLLSTCVNSNIKYPAGKDTHMMFGDGTFQISGKQRGLFYGGGGAPIISFVKSVYTLETTVYLIGNEEDEDIQVYGIINLNESTMRIHYANLELERAQLNARLGVRDEGVLFVVEKWCDFTETEQAIFQDRTLFTDIE